MPIARSPLHTSIVFIRRCVGRGNASETVRGRAVKQSSISTKDSSAPFPPRLLVSPVSTTFPPRLLVSPCSGRVVEHEYRANVSPCYEICAVPHGARAGRAAGMARSFHPVQEAEEDAEGVSRGGRDGRRRRRRRPPVRVGTVPVHVAGTPTHCAARLLTRVSSFVVRRSSFARADI